MFITLSSYILLLIFLKNKLINKMTRLFEIIFCLIIFILIIPILILISILIKLDSKGPVIFFRKSWYQQKYFYDAKIQNNESRYRNSRKR